MTLIRSLAILGLAIAGTGLALAQSEPEVAPAPAAPPTANVSVTLTLDSASDIERTVVRYLCDDEQTLTIQYINAAPNFLAIVPVDGENHVFVTTLSASGARYVSGPFEWWNTGSDATLRDLTQGEDAEPLASCSEGGNTP